MKKTLRNLLVMFITVTAFSGCAKSEGNDGAVLLGKWRLTDMKVLDLNDNVDIIQAGQASGECALNVEFNENRIKEISNRPGRCTRDKVVIPEYSILEDAKYTTNGIFITFDSEKYGKMEFSYTLLNDVLTLIYTPSDKNPDDTWKRTTTLHYKRM